jgi:hypothetical protein
MILLKKTASVMAVAATIFLGTMTVAAPTAIAAPVGKSGTVMTKAEMSGFDCHKGGYWESVGWAKCSGTRAFRVQVWCTWGGQGVSAESRETYNWAECERGRVHTEDNGIEIIWS